MIAYLITGSPKGAYDDDLWIARLADFINLAYAESSKLVGVCFGHQMLAHTLGGKAEKSHKGWGLGLKKLDVSEKRPFMSPSLENGNFYFCHQDQVVQLPSQAERLAGNEFCPNGMFVIGNQVFGIQAHPEFTADVMEKAVNWIDETMPDQKAVVAGAKKANGTADNLVIAHWIVNFLVE